MYALMVDGNCSFVLPADDERVFFSTVKINLVSVWAGSKRTCPPADLAEEEDTGAKRPACVSAKGIHNFSYPRTGFPFNGVVVDGQIRLLSSPFCPKMAQKL